jgi:putative tricarboxylic transport membrane protein
MTIEVSRPAGATSDRIGAITLFTLAIVYGIGATQISYSFSSDPLGPRVFPLMLSGLLGLLSLIYFFFPGGAETWPRGRGLAGVISIPMLVLASALLLEPVGFGIAMMVLVTGVGRIFGASWRNAILGGILQAVLWFVIFSYLLSVYLPGGAVFGH